MRETKKFEDLIAGIDDLDYHKAFELRISLLEFMNYLMNTYVLVNGKIQDEALLNECNKMQDVYSLLQQLTKNKQGVVDPSQLSEIKKVLTRCLGAVKNLLAAKDRVKL